MKIVLGYPAEPHHIRRVQSSCPGAEIVPAAPPELSKLLEGADIFCGHARAPVDWPAVVQSGRLRWIQSSAAGLDHCLVPDIIDSPVMVSSASGVFADSVAEQTLALLLSLVRRLHIFSAAWSRREFQRLPTDDLKGKTVCMAGLGGNGSRIATLLRPFGVRILATDWFPRAHAAVDMVQPPEALHSLLAQSDILIITVPLTEKTREFIGRDELSRLRTKSYVINVARGRVVEEGSLIEALASGHLAGAGLDVTHDEPPSPDSPLWHAPNLIVTPHVGAQSATRYDRMTDLFCINLQRFLSGQTLFNGVEKKLGFPNPENRWHPQ